MLFVIAGKKDDDTDLYEFCRLNLSQERQYDPAAGTLMDGTPTQDRQQDNDAGDLDQVGILQELPVIDKGKYDTEADSGKGAYDLSGNHCFIHVGSRSHDEDPADIQGRDEDQQEKIIVFDVVIDLHLLIRLSIHFFWQIVTENQPAEMFMVWMPRAVEPVMVDRSVAP